MVFVVQNECTNKFESKSQQFAVFPVNVGVVQNECTNKFESKSQLLETLHDGTVRCTKRMY